MYSHAVLSHLVTIYIPTEFIGEVAETFEFLVRLHGGCTKRQVTGGYLMADKTICEEEITTLQSYCSEINEATLLDYAADLCFRMGQETVAVEIDGKLNLVGSACMAIAA